MCEEGFASAGEDDDCSICVARTTEGKTHRGYCTVHCVHYVDGDVEFRDEGAARARRRETLGCNQAYSYPLNRWEMQCTYNLSTTYSFR